MVSAQFVIGILCATILVSAKLDKPALRNDLDDLKPGLLKSLQSVKHNTTVWPSGQLPQACVNITKDNNLDPTFVTAYSVQYSDCDDPWILCRHKASPISITKAVDMFGRLPVGTRQWVRHMIFLPDKKNGAHAYNQNANIAMFDTVGDAMTIYFHEAGHSLDLQGAFSNRTTSNSQDWLHAYDQDSNVPDNYARTNQVENVAQNIVVAAFDKIVPGGFAKLEPAWQNVSHQFQFIQSQSEQSGNLILPGGRCTHRLANSKPVDITPSSRVRRAVDLPNAELSGRVTVVEPRQFDTRDLGCLYSH